jgi:hypothetical protein
MFRATPPRRAGLSPPRGRRTINKKITGIIHSGQVTALLHPQTLYGSWIYARSPTFAHMGAILLAEVGQQGLRELSSGDRKWEVAAKGLPHVEDAE